MAGTAKSSIMTVVPAFLRLPTDGKSPFLSFQSPAASLESEVNSGFIKTFLVLRSLMILLIFASLRFALWSPVSIKRAHASSCRPLRCFGAVGWSSMALRLERSKSSTASIFCFFNSVTTEQAETMSGNKTSAVPLCAGSGIVL